MEEKTKKKPVKVVEEKFKQTRSDEEIMRSVMKQYKKTLDDLSKR